MSDATNDSEPAFHLFLEPDEVSVAVRALRLLIADEAHQQTIRELARNVLAGLAAAPDDGELLTIPLTAPEMKITHTAVRLLLGDLQREQDAERQILWRILNKLPDEHAIRAITID